MNRVKPFWMIVSIAAIATITGCGQKNDAPATTSSSDKIAEIAGDKGTMAEMMKQSHTKGTFDDALALAIQDSALAMEVLAVIQADPRLSALLVSTPAERATSNGSAGVKSARTTSRTTTTTSTPNKDVLDQAEETAKKANERLDQAQRVKKQAEEAKKKVDDIFKP